MTQTTPIASGPSQARASAFSVQRAGSALCFLFLVALAFVCDRRPIPDDFDRYIYEAIILQKSEPLGAVYQRVKHESSRTEGSTVLDSAQHLLELEPLYRIRPFYLQLISLLSTLMSVQRAINIVSATSLLGIGIIVLLWSRKPLQTALLMMAYPVLNLGRGGTPDALAALLAIAALWLIHENKHQVVGIAILMVSLGVRTDNVLILLGVLAWMALEQRVRLFVLVAAALFSIAIVLGINRAVGNYGWVVLFRYSFIGGKYPSQIPPTLTISQYLTAFSVGIGTALSQLSIWLLIGVWAWLRRPNSLLLLLAGVAILHFLLFPSPEIRYLMWAGITSAVCLMRSFNEEVPATMPFRGRLPSPVH